MTDHGPRLFSPAPSTVRVTRNWHICKDGDPVGLALYERHYSAYRYADKRERKLFVGPGEKVVLISTEGDALFVWRKFLDDSGQTGVNCAVFRNEGDISSSELILEAERIANVRWPGERLYTYVKAEATQSNNPGYCFKKAGWKSDGKTKGGLYILAKGGVGIIPTQENVDESPTKKNKPGQGRPPIPDDTRRKRRNAMFLTDREYEAVLALIEVMRSEDKPSENAPTG